MVTNVTSDINECSRLTYLIRPQKFTKFYQICAFIESLRLRDYVTYVIAFWMDINIITWIIRKGIYQVDTSSIHAFNII